MITTDWHTDIGLTLLFRHYSDELLPPICRTIHPFLTRYGVQIFPPTDPHKLYSGLVELRVCQQCEGAETRYHVPETDAEAEALTAALMSSEPLGQPLTPLPATATSP